MRAADECHPLPDQLHPCSGFFGSLRFESCDRIGAEKIDAFHDAFDRFSGGNCFCVREVLVPEACLPFASPVFVTRLGARLHLFEWLASHARRAEIVLPELP